MIPGRQFHVGELPKAISRTALAFLPSYVQDYLTESDSKPSRLHSTSALDGLRGIAALFIFFFHVLFSYQQFVEYGYGQGESDENRRLIQLPFIRLFYAGHAMVAVFFVVGGYVMSIKPLSFIHLDQKEALLNSLVSSVFRRGIRLYLPAITATFVTMLTIYFGLWECPRQFITEDQKYIFYADYHPQRGTSFGAQMRDWMQATAGLTNIFTYYNDGFLMPYYNQYDPHLWTVPFEYRSSLIASLATLALSRCRKSARLLLMLTTVIFCGLWARWEAVCFLSGSLLCAINTSSRPYEPSSDSDSDLESEKISNIESNCCSPHPHSLLSKALHPTTKLISQPRPTLLFTLGLYLLSAPNLSISTTPGYAWLTSITPSTYTDPKRFPHTIGAILVTYAVTTSPLLQKPFNTAFAQYLGRISYSLYIVHGPLIHIVGYSVTPGIWRVLGVSRVDGSRVSYWFGLALGTSVLGVVVAVGADLFYRVVDTRSVRLAKWFESVCFEEREGWRSGRLG